MKTPTLIFSLVIFLMSCNSHITEVNFPESENLQSAEDETADEEVVPKNRLDYFIYGSFCGECEKKCSVFYQHNMIGNMSTSWADYTDSYFSKNGLQFETAMSREAEKIGYELVRKIPNSILETSQPLNIIGCPDCDDGCGLYFEFKLSGAEPVVYKLEYSLNSCTGELKEFGEQLLKTLKRLEAYR